MDRLTTERHLKQNKEIIRINQVQSNRIVALEAEVTKLLSENIQLRTQVIQLTHKQDLSTQKAQIDRKLRELQRLIRTFGDAATTISSPAPPLIRKSPRKADLLSLTAEQSPGPARPDFVSSRSRPRSLAAPARVVRSPAPSEKTNISEMATPMEASVVDQCIELDREGKREAKERERAREARRSSRRMSRTSDEIIPLPQTELDSDHSVSNRKISQDERPPSSFSERIERGSQRRSRTSTSFDSAPLRYQSENSTDPRKGYHSGVSAYDEDDKENAPSERRSTASIRLLHSSPVKSRSALNVVVDPLPCANIQTKIQTPAKPLNEVAEIKSEPTSPALAPADSAEDKKRNEAPEESAGRSRRAKTVNYAEPSLRHKMRRTETLPGDKRRKSSYRRTSSSIMDEAQRSAAAHQTITIDED